ncbi:hypothetical protein DOTSEDRAFT_38099 [Dothistroma septosporum NZE10]|uniref:BTB domain-containing protein n=1 Tax=Dothistroma septosporum (strain NZE10 / CBS 128990) TaxID=675120 RepID=N1PFM7_DOTSN|nr:hypothetical protein DOTSEDRAFT_38099 [Dothistroma septosporum NZE10]
MYASKARPAVRRSKTWDDLAALKARLSRPGTPLTLPLPRVLDPRASPPGRRAYGVEQIITTSSIVTVRVGEAGDRFHVHRSAPIQSSIFPQMKYKLEWLKLDSVIELSDHNPESFAIYSNWVYTSIINSTSGGHDPIPAAQHREWIDLAKSYVLGEALIDTVLTDIIMDTIRAKVLGESGDTIWKAAVELVQIVNESTLRKAHARRFLVDLYHYHAHTNHLEAGKDDFSRDILL